MTWIESAQDNFREALLERDDDLASDIIKDVREKDEDEADKLQEELDKIDSRIEIDLG